jgi:hypothetical protein
MTTSKSSGTSRAQGADQSNASITERASGVLQSGVERVKSNPGMTAAIVGGVAAAAAATVYRDKISETIGGLRSGSRSNDGSSSQTH